MQHNGSLMPERNIFCDSEAVHDMDGSGNAAALPDIVPETRMMCLPV